MNSTSGTEPTAATVNFCGAVGIAAATSLVPVALFAGALWWLLSLVVAMAALAYLWRPA